MQDLIAGRIDYFCALAAAAMPQITEASEFVKQAAAGGDFEIKSGRMALKQSKSEDLKRIAQKLIDDHTKGGKELKATVKEAKIKAKIPEKLDQKHAAMVDTLKKAQGADFDKTFVSQQLDAHRDAIAVLYGDNPESGREPGRQEALEVFIQQAGAALENAFLQRKLQDLKGRDAAPVA